MMFNIAYFVVGSFSLYLMVYRWHWSYTTWVVVTLPIIATLSFVQYIIRRACQKRSQAFDRIKWLITQHLASVDSESDESFDVDTEELHTLLLATLHSKDMVNTFCEYRFKCNYNDEVTAHSLLLVAITYLLSRAIFYNYDFVDREYYLSERGKYLRHVFEESCYCLDYCGFFSTESVVLCMERLDDLIESTKKNLPI